MKADFIHELTQYNWFDVIKIEDLDLGNISVTNDIENVVADIATMEKIDPKKYIVVYKDSDGYFDGWDPQSERFISIRKTSLGEAVRAFLSNVE